ncbi:MAG: L,D-transpeptidase [Candidatus Woesearchaeota archaeon]
MKERFKLFHYKNNKIFDTITCVPIEKFNINLETEIISEEDLLSGKEKKQKIIINTTENIMHIMGMCYEIATGEKTPCGKFIVSEKWENPYWKKNGFVYLPSPKNPIGKYLIILIDTTYYKKIPYSIHQWPNNIEKLNYGEFKKGTYSQGCIRTKAQDIEAIFKKIELGAEVVIVK